MQIDLTDEGAVALLALLDRAIENDRFLLCRLGRGRCAASARNFWVSRPHHLQPDRCIWDGHAVSCVC
jgi:hypothetical protein